jgi:TRAP transporter TAXI family solute receptor
MQRIGLRLICAVTMAAGALAGPAESGEPYWPDQLTIATASPGGTYYVYGEGLAKLLTRALELPVTMRPTEGPAQNIELLEAGETKLAFVTTGIALHAWNASGAWTGRKPARAMRVIFPMYDTPFHLLVLQDSGIRSLAEAAGKRIGVGPHGGTTAAYVPDFLAALKIPATYAFGDWSDLAAQMHGRSLDMLAVAAGVPFPSFIELEAKDKVRYVAFGPIRLRRCALRCRSSRPRSLRPEPIPPSSATIRRWGFTTSRWRTRDCRAISSFVLSKPCSTITSSWWRSMQRRPPPFPRTWRATRSCRSIPARSVTTLGSGARGWAIEWSTSGPHGPHPERARR